MLYTRLPTEAELASSGFTLADYEEIAEVWPENWPAVELMLMLGTQWKHGFNGPTALDYAVVYATLDRKGYAGDDFWEMLDDLRVMEATALNTLRSD